MIPSSQKAVTILMQAGPMNPQHLRRISVGCYSIIPTDFSLGISLTTCWISSYVGVISIHPGILAFCHFLIQKLKSGHSFAHVAFSGRVNMIQVLVEEKDFKKKILLIFSRSSQVQLEGSDAFPCLLRFELFNLFFVRVSPSCNHLTLLFLLALAALDCSISRTLSSTFCRCSIFADVGCSATAILSL